MLIKELSWESKHFGYPCACLERSFETIESAELKRLPYRLIVMKSTRPLQEFSHFLIDEKVTFCKTIQKKAEEVSGEVVTRKKLTLELLKLSFESGKNSRFFLDPNFKSNEFETLYSQWIENSLNATFADEVFVLGSYQDPLGLVTIKKKDNEAHIGLLSIKESHQGQRLGQKLIEWSEHYCHENKLKELCVSTQRSNINACRFYEKNGFKIKSMEYIYHWWNL